MKARQSRAPNRHNAGNNLPALFLTRLKIRFSQHPSRKTYFETRHFTYKLLYNLYAFKSRLFFYFVHIFETMLLALTLDKACEAGSYTRFTFYSLICLGIAYTVAFSCRLGILTRRYDPPDPIAFDLFHPYLSH